MAHNFFKMAPKRKLKEKKKNRRSSALPPTTKPHPSATNVQTAMGHDQQMNKHETAKKHHKENPKKQSVEEIKEAVYTQEDVNAMAYELQTTKKELNFFKKLKTPQGEVSVAATALKIKCYVKQTLFCSVKFISDMQGLDRIGKKVVKHFQIPKERRESFWIAYKQITLKALTQQCNVVIQSIKERWNGK